MMFWVVIGTLIYVAGAVILTAIAALSDRKIDTWECGMVGMLWPIIVPFTLIVAMGVLVVATVVFLLSLIAQGLRGRETRG